MEWKIKLRPPSHLVRFPRGVPHGEGEDVSAEVALPHDVLDAVHGRDLLSRAVNEQLVGELKGEHLQREKGLKIN